MRSEFLKIALSVMILCLGAGAEELLPKLMGVGFPILLTAAQSSSARRPVLQVALFAVAAGAMEDAISSLAPMTSASFFLMVALLSHWTGLPRLMTLLTYPCYQLWLAVWAAGSADGFCLRLLVSVPVGLITAYVVGTLVQWATRKAAVDELG